MTLRLDTQAQSLLNTLQRQSGLISPAAQKALEQASATQGTLSAQQVTQVLVDAMPDKRQQIVDVGQVSPGHHPDGRNPALLTQILSTRIEKTTRVYASVPVKVDPLFLDLKVDPGAAQVLLFNARDVDEAGRPRLMKVLYREGHQPSAQELAGWRGEGVQLEKLPAGETVSTKVDKEEWLNFGDPVLQVSMGADHKELSRSVAMTTENTQITEEYSAYDRTRPRKVNKVSDPRLDQLEPNAFWSKLGVDVRAPELGKPGTWLDTPLTQAEASLKLGSGFIFEPGASVAITVGGDKKLDAAVPKDDASFAGSRATEVKLDRVTTLRSLLEQQLRVTYKDQNHEETVLPTLAWSLYRQFDGMKIGGESFSPLQTHSYSYQDKLRGRDDASRTRWVHHNISTSGVQFQATPVAGKPNAYALDVTLPKGLLDLAGCAGSLKGWKYEVTYSGGPVTSGVQELTGEKSSGEASVKLELANLMQDARAHSTLQIRFFNPQGLPAYAMSFDGYSVARAAGLHPYGY